MEWETFAILFGMYTGIITLIFGFGVPLSVLMTEKSQRGLGYWLSIRVNRDPVAWIQNSSTVFIRLFNLLYGGQRTPIERTVWVVLILSIMLLFEERALGYYSDPAEILIVSIIFALGTAFGIQTGKSLVTVSRGMLLFAEIITAVGLWCLIIWTVIYDVKNRVFVTPAGAVSPGVSDDFTIEMLGAALIGLLIGLMVGVVAGHFHHYQLKPYPRLFYMAVLGGIVVGTFVGISAALSGGIIFGIIIIIGLFVGLPIVILITIERITLPVNPLKALFWSVFFMAVVSLFRWDAAASFYRAVINEGGKPLSFVAFNMFADGFSLLETLWILQTGARVGLRTIGILLVLDILASAAIFIVIPTALGQLSEFQQAVFFRGARPWLGILFWTTFSTSIVFYLFVLSALLVRPLSYLPKLGRHLQVDKQPVLTMTFALAVALTPIFWGGVTGVTLYNGGR